MQIDLIALPGLENMNIGIIGTGKMGSAIFRLLAGRPYQITVLAIDEVEARASEKQCLKLLTRSLRRQKISEDDFREKKESLIFTHHIEDLAAAEIVIEAIFEDYDEKVDLFHRLESVVDRKTVLVTNTSSLSIEQLAGQLKYKDRFCGLHFFYPVVIIKLVEIIRSPDTSDQMIGFLRELCKDIDMHAIVVNDAPGSMVNFVLAHYYVEALYLLEEGCALPSEIDAVAKNFFYIGPCESLDVIGIDFFLAALTNIMDEFIEPRTDGDTTISSIREGYYLPYLFNRLVADNRVGKKATKGIYLYQRDKAIDDVPEFYINPEHKGIIKNTQSNDDIIGRRLLYSVFNGSLHCLKQKMSTLHEVDLGIKEVLLMKEGPCTMMQRIGKHVLAENFDYLKQHVGRRFKNNQFEFLFD